MALFKKLTKKIVEDVKDTVKEETHKTTGEIVDEAKSRMYDILPEAIMFISGLVLISIVKKPTPVIVKVIVEHI